MSPFRSIEDEALAYYLALADDGTLAEELHHAHGAIQTGADERSDRLLLTGYAIARVRGLSNFKAEGLALTDKVPCRVCGMESKHTREQAEEGETPYCIICGSFEARMRRNET